MEFAKTHQPCPCGKSSDAYSIRVDGSGYCFGQCGGTNHFPKNYKPSQCKAEPLGERGIPSVLGEMFRFEALKDDKGNVLFYRYNYPNGVKKYRRVVDKHHWWDKPNGVETPAIGGIGMFDMPSSKTCVLVEGEPDAPSAYHMLNSGMTTETPVYWLTSATISSKGRMQIFDELSKYDRVIMAFEDDEAGRKAKEVLANLLPKQIRVATLNKHKDANDYLQAGDEKEFKRAVKAYSHYTPEYIATGLGDFEKIWRDEKQDFYIPTGFENLDEMIPGIPLGHVTLVSGPEGIGKTEFLRAIEWNILNYGVENDPDIQNTGCSITHFEETDKLLLKGLACYDQKRNFRDKNVDFPWEDVRPTLEKLKDRLFITNLYKARDELSVRTFMDKIEYLHFVCGVRYFFFDPINQLRPDSPDEPLVKFLDGLSMEAARFANDHQVAFVWTAHVNDEGATRDSRMIAKAASIRIDVARDLQTFDEDERNKTYVRVAKNRAFGPTGEAGAIRFDPATYTLHSDFSSDGRAMGAGGTVPPLHSKGLDNPVGKPIPF